MLIVAAWALFVPAAKGQQAKAYEVIPYIARSGKVIFYLDYADGYLAAGRIKMVEQGHKLIIFMPQSGAPESNGDLIFSSGSRKITLKNIREDETAPMKIKAIYRTGQITWELLFYRKK